MDFSLSPDQQDLRDSVRAVLGQACPPSLVRQAHEAKPDEFQPAALRLWQQMVDLDWPAIAIPERFGGLGSGFVELSLVVEELGRVAAPGPFLATVTQFAPMVRETATGEQAGAFLRPLVAGRQTGTLALAEPSGRWEWASVDAVARRTTGGWVLNGTKSWVLDGATADQIAVVARAEGSTGADGLGVFVVPGSSARATAQPGIDPTMPLAELTFEDTPVPDAGVLAEPGPAVAGPAGRAVQEATACLATATTGTCRTIFETTLSYAKDRQQYGRPIGSFQALKHRLVGMYTRLERSAALNAFAALAIAEDDEQRELAVSMAKAAAGDSQRLMVGEGIQLHGGIGFTWENDLQLFLKRAKTGDFLFGTGRAHRSAVARLSGLSR